VRISSLCSGFLNCSCSSDLLERWQFFSPFCILQLVTYSQASLHLHPQDGPFCRYVHQHCPSNFISQAPKCHLLGLVSSHKNCQMKMLLNYWPTWNVPLQVFNVCCKNVKIAIENISQAPICDLYNRCRKQVNRWSRHLGCGDLHARTHSSVAVRDSTGIGVNPLAILFENITILYFCILKSGLNNSIVISSGRM